MVVLPLVPVTADDAELGGRVAPEAGGDRRHRRPRVGDERPGCTGQVELALDDQRRRPGLDRRRREVVAVGVLADDAEEERPGADPAAVVGEARDIDAGVADEARGIEPSDQLSEFQPGRF